MGAISRPVFAALTAAAVLFAQQALDNESVLRVVKAGLSDDVVVGMINNQPGKYAVSPDDLVALKTAGVPDKVIAAMVNNNAAASNLTTGVSR